ncbi:3-phenylpropionate MFS transporter [Rhodospirillaceae bacterium SYSU D60014]|uniref:3-phenylpropionate MFS transporter n=1 Tax=Virgifigura deserti TaxID=2268457 RepID=UPI000E66905F
MFLPLRLSLFYVAYFTVVGITLPFWPVWLKAQGLDGGEIGILLSLPFWVKLLTNPLIARKADRLGQARRPLILLALGSLAGYALFIFAGGFWSILVITVLSSICLTALMPLGDSLTIRTAIDRQLDYGRIRLWGSLSFILAASVGGGLFAGRSPNLILDALLVALALTVAACLGLPEQRPAPRRAADGGVSGLLADRRFLLFLAGASLIQASHGVLYGFGTLHWQAAGYARDTIGWLWAEGVVAEILLFSFGATVLRRLGSPGLLILGGVAAVVRWMLLGFSTDLPVLILAQVLHGLTFGATHLAAIDFLGHAAPPGLSATAQSLYGAVALGAVSGVVMLFSGTLYETFGGAAFFAMTGLAIAGTMVAALLARVSPAIRFQEVP